MRIVKPEQVKASLGVGEGLHFDGARGERLHIDVLDHDLIRVRHHPDGKARLDRTWMVVGKDGEIPLEGRSRDDLSPFPLPAVEISWDVQSPYVTAETSLLKLKITLGDFRIEWFDKED